MATESSCHIRPATIDDAPGIARVHVDSWRTTYRGIVPDSVLSNLDYDQRADIWRRAMSSSTSGERVSVAESPQPEIIGFVSGGPERTREYPGYTGEIYALYLDESWQGRGLGRKLFRVGVDSLVDQGFESMLIWVLKDNPACGFYERMGGKPIASQPIQAGQKTLEEIAYGWENIRALLDSRL